jgi:hypothetical protein
MPTAASSSAVAANNPGEQGGRAPRDEAVVDADLHRFNVVESEGGVELLHGLS